MLRRTLECILFILFAALPTLGAVIRSPRWLEVGEDIGIGATEGDKTSPPAVADLNQDGYLDIVMCNHARQEFEIFYGGEDNFTRTTFFSEQQDRHGVALGDFDSDGDIDILLAIGGTNGLVPATPVVGESEKMTRSLTRRESMELGLDGREMRGIASRFVDIDSDGDLDLIVLSRPPLEGGPRHAVYENVRGTYVLHSETGLEFGKTGGLMSVDYNADGHADVIMLGNGIQIWKGNGNFNFVDGTQDALGGRKSDFGWPFAGISAFDVDNDGDLDLYLAGGRRMKKGRSEPYNDVLFENDDGVFVDASRKWGIPTGGTHLGVTTGDFNNDGFQDVFISRAGPGMDRILDLVLLNKGVKGKKSFKAITSHGANGELDKTYGMGAQLLDYNKDGKLDIVVSARQTPIHGRMRLYKNRQQFGNSITVSLPTMTVTRVSTSDAIVRLSAGGVIYTRRCGSGQGEYRTQSMITDVHFGIGHETTADQVNVTLSTGHSYQFEGPFPTGRFIPFELD